MSKFLSVFSVVALCLLSFSGFAEAKKSNLDIDATTKVVDSISSNEISYQAVNKQLSDIEETLKSGQIPMEKINEDVKLLVNFRSRLIEARKQSDKELQFVQRRLGAIGEAPKEGDTELEVITQKRKEFTNEEAFQKAKIAEADLMLAKIDELDTLIINVRNKELLGNLLVRQSPLIYPQVFFPSTKLFVEFFFDIIKSPITWYSELGIQKQNYVKSNIIPVSLIVLFSLWIGVYLRLLIMKKFGYKKDIEHPRYSTRVFAAIFVAIAYGVIPATIVGGFIIWMYSTKVMTIGFFGLVINTFLYYSLYMILAKAVSRVLFAPYNEKWRLVNVTTEKAKRVSSALYFSVFSIGIFAFLERIATSANYSIELISYISSVSSGVKAFCIVLIVKRLLWDGLEEPQDGDADAEELEEEDEEINTAFKITFFLSIFTATVFGMAIFGYPKLASFIFNRFIISIIIIGFLLITRKTLMEVIHRLLLLRIWVKTFKLRRRMIHKVNFWLSLFIDPIFIFFGILSILGLWGVSTDLLLQSMKKLFMGFTVGGVEISLVAIVMGVVVFFVSIAVVKALRTRLLNNVLSKMEIDDGIKHSLASGFGFFGFIISLVIAIGVMGGNLSNLALIAGALSFGIGLGLQNIVNNFVSGIILLFERPIKVGDWVIVNGQEGVVKQINIRATELITWKRATIIIPNADILSSNVTNLTHDDKWGRIDITIGVAYGTDIDKVRDVLVEIADNHKRVLKKPAPYAVFVNFGESSLDFELRCYTADVMNALMIGSEIRFEINRRFIEEHIEIPFPQRVLHLGDKLTRDSINSALAKKIKSAKNES